MISITHFFDRDGQTLTSISPRPYFCIQCHVPQHTVRAPIENDFVDIDTLLSRAAPGGAAVTATEASPPSFARRVFVCAQHIERASAAEHGVQARHSRARGLCRRNHFLGGVQHCVGADERRALLHLVPRNAHQRVRRAQNDRALHQSLGRACLLSGFHVPHSWTDKIARKMQASKEVWGKIFGTIDTREKFLDHRAELAAYEWARMKANDSLECRILSQRRIDGHHPLEPPRGRRAPSFPLHRAENPHRLPQGHRPQAARYAQYPGVAVTRAGAPSR
jgi:NapC/NirT cytochrome c family protein/nitrate reductase cytochrome c-type subunit NapB